MNGAPLPAVERGKGWPSPPSAEELAAIVAAVEAVWPRPVIALVADEEEEAPPTWRFSGRWWARPVPARRDRP